MASDDYIDINRNAWNLKTAVHLNSDFYRIDSYTSLKEIELNLLGDITGKTVLHLQCHFGQDSLSLARMGARVTGADLSDKAIEAAREIAAKEGIAAKFICSDLYALPEVLDEKFDIVFASYGTIGWLPDMDKWAAVVSHFLKPGGRFVFVEFHPVIWMFDGKFKEIEYSYFKKEVIVENITGSYADRDADISYQTHSWNHSLSEVIGSLLKHGVNLSRFEEHDYSPYPCFKNLTEVAPDKYRFTHFYDKLPMVYAIEGHKA